jgi:hypothetical protein
MAKLEVEIGADNSEFKSKIKEVEFDIKELSKVKLEQIKLGIDTKQIDSEIKDAKMSLKTLQTTLKDTGTSFTKLEKPVQNGGNTLMQFSRIAQDAPFGIMGIGNNITATAESFAHLSNSAGGTGNALKAVASSMLGTGGILLAVSLVTTALTIMSQNGITVSDIFDKLTGNFNEFGGSLKKASEESAKGAIEEMGALKGLIAVAQSETVSRKARTQAVKDLQSQYPAYFGNLSNEQIMYGNLSGVIKNVTNALINKGIAEKLTKDAVDPTLELWRANGKLNKAKEDQIQLEKDLAKETAKRIAGGFGGRTNEEVSLMNTIKNTKLAITTTRSDIKDLTVVVDSYKKGIEEASKASSKLLIKTDKVEKVAKPKKIKEPKRDKQSFGGDFIPGGAVLGSLGSQLTEFQQSSSLLNMNIVPDVKDISQKTKDIEAALLSFNTNVNSIIGETLSSTFMNLGAVIGDALANGANVMQAAGSALLSSIGGLLSAMGGELIKLGTAAVLAGTVTSTFGSIIGIGAGIAAIAGGTLLSGLGAAVSSRANQNVSGFGGQRGGTISTGASVSSPTASTNNNTGGGFQNVVFEISGQSLIGVLSSSLDRNNRLGGGLKLTT